MSLRGAEYGLALSGWSKSKVFLLDIYCSYLRFSREWIATITGWPENFEYDDMEEVGKRLSVKLRDPDGEYYCDFIIALTHSRYAVVPFICLDWCSSSVWCSIPNVSC